MSKKKKNNDNQSEEMKNNYLDIEKNIESTENNEVLDSTDQEELKQSVISYSFGKKGHTEEGKRNRTMTKRIATIVTLVVTVAIFLMNMGVSTLSNSMNLTMDWTSNKLFALSIQTRQYLNRLEKDVEIIVLTKESTLTQNSNAGVYFIQVNNVLRGIEKDSDHVQLSYKDLSESPELYTRFPDVTLSEGDILVVSGDKKVQVPINSLFNLTDYYTAEGNVMSYYSSSKAEQELLSAILLVTQESPLNITFLSGIGSVDTTSFQNLLKLNAYQVENRSFLDENWWEDTDVLVLAGPENDLTTSEIENLQNFLSNPEKTLLYFPPFNPKEEQLNLTAFLAEWGMEIDPGLIYENNSQNYYYVNENNKNEFITYSEYAQNAFGASLENEDGLRVFLPYTHPIQLLYEQEGSRNTFPLLTFLESAQSYNIETPDDAGPRGPFNGAVISERRFESQEGVKYSQVVVIGSENSIEKSYLSYTFADNSAYFIRLFQSLYPDNSPDIVIEEKVLDPAQLDITENQTKMLAIIFIGMIPAIIILGGLFEWVRRRKL